MTDAELEELEAARAALLHYGQADEEGIIVTTSRQAIHEVDDALFTLISTTRELRAELEKRDRVVEAARIWAKLSPTNDQLQQREGTLRAALAALDDNA